MKISKKPAQTVQACDMNQVAPAVATDAPVAPNTTLIGQVSDIVAADPREQAKCYIQSAIGALTAIAEGDLVAKESIANLAVVLMDLQG